MGPKSSALLGCLSQPLCRAPAGASAPTPGTELYQHLSTEKDVKGSVLWVGSGLGADAAGLPNNRSKVEAELQACPGERGGDKALQGEAGS